MNDYFSTLYVDLQKRIKAQVPDIKWIEQDFGQDVYDQWRPNVSFPAALIDFPNTDYSMESTTSQMGEVTVVIRLLFAPFSQSYDKAPITVREKALKYFGLEQQLVNALHGWMPKDKYTQPFVRTNARSNNRNDIGLRIRELTFTTLYEEDFED